MARAPRCSSDRLAAGAALGRRRRDAPPKRRRPGAKRSVGGNRLPEPARLIVRCCASSPDRRFGPREAVRVKVVLPTSAQRELRAVGEWQRALDPPLLEEWWDSPGPPICPPARGWRSPLLTRPRPPALFSPVSALSCQLARRSAQAARASVASAAPAAAAAALHAAVDVDGVQDELRECAPPASLARACVRACRRDDSTCAGRARCARWRPAALARPCSARPAPHAWTSVTSAPPPLTRSAGRPPRRALPH